MSFPGLSLFGEVVTRLRFTTAGDRYGDPVRSGTAAELNITGALFAPAGSLEPIAADRTAVIDQPAVYFPGQWPDIVPTDQLWVRGVVYETTGDPEDWRSGAGSPLGGLKVSLRKVSG